MSRIAKTINLKTVATVPPLIGLVGTTSTSSPIKN